MVPLNGKRAGSAAVCQLVCGCSDVCGHLPVCVCKWGYESEFLHDRDGG